MVVGILGILECPLCPPQMLHPDDGKLSSCIFDGRVGGGQSGATTMLALRCWPVRCGGGRTDELKGGHRFWALNF